MLKCKLLLRHFSKLCNMSFHPFVVLGDTHVMGQLRGIIHYVYSFNLNKYKNILLRNNYYIQHRKLLKIIQILRLFL